MRQTTRVKAKRLYFDRNPHGYLIADHDYNVIEVNEAFTTLAGCTSAEVVGQKIMDLLLINERFDCEMLHREQQLNCIGQIFCPKEQRAVGRRLEISISAIRAEEGWAYYLRFSTIGSVRPTDEALRLDAMLLDAEARAAEGIMAKQRLLRVVSHDLRTPMNAITAAVRLSREMALPPELSLLLDVIDNSAICLEDNLDSMISFAALEGLGGAGQAVCPERLLNQIVENLVRQRHIPADQVRSSYAGDPHGAILCDTTSLALITNNLISLGLRAATMSPIALTFSLIEDGPFLEIDLQVPSPGLTPEVCSSLRQGFTSDGGASIEVSQINLTAFMAGQTIADLDGELVLPADDGTRVQVTLHVTIAPREARHGGRCGSVSVADDPPDRPQLHLPPETGQYPAGEHAKTPARHVLIIDDNETNQVVMKLRLQNMGVIVSSAVSGPKAIALLKDPDQPAPDLIFLDRDMPRMTGSETAIRIRDIPRMRDVPIIGMSAHINATIKAEMLAAGMSHVFEKPVDYDEIHTILEPVSDQARPAPAKDGIPSLHEGSQSAPLAPGLLVARALRTELPVLGDAIHRSDFSGIASQAHLIAGTLAAGGRLADQKRMARIEINARAGIPPDEAQLKWLEDLA